MTLTIDSAPIDLPPLPEETFKEYLNRVAAMLLKDQLCVGTCQLDGQTVHTLDEGDELFPKSSHFTVDTVPLHIALQANIALQCNAVRQIEDDCENLITDSLLADPQQIADAWTSLCESVKGVINFLPSLNGLMSDEQVDTLIDVRLAALNDIMREIAGVLSTADVVSFSDLLELKLAPWLVGLREFLQEQLEVVEAISKNAE